MNVFLKQNGLFRNKVNASSNTFKSKILKRHAQWMTYPRKGPSIYAEQS